MDATARAAHWTDYALAGRSKRRAIKRGSNWRYPGGVWQPSDPAVVQQGAAPPHWSGAWDFSLASVNGPLQFFCRDATDTGNRAMVGVRITENPNAWINWKAHNVNAVEPILGADGQTVVYVNLWDGCDWELQAGASSLKDTIRIRDKSVAPSAFTWTLKIGAGYALQGRADGFHLVDAQGVSVGRMSWPIAWDANGSELEPNIPCTMGPGPTINGMPTVQITPDATAMASAVGEVVIDPTTTISGTADIEDALCLQSSHANYGGHSNLNAGPFGQSFTALRVATGALPAGTIDAFRYICTPTVALTRTITGRILKDANDWIEGTSAGAAEAGAVDWYDAQHGVLAWAGGDGCDVAGVDWDDDPAAPEALVTGDASTPITFDLKPEWATAWRDATRLNNGWALWSISGGSFPHYASEDASNPNAFEIDYTAGPSSFPFYFSNLLRQRRG